MFPLFFKMTENGSIVRRLNWLSCHFRTTSQFRVQYSKLRIPKFVKQRLTILVYGTKAQLALFLFLHDFTIPNAVFQITNSKIHETMLGFHIFFTSEIDIHIQGRQTVTNTGIRTKATAYLLKQCLTTLTMLDDIKFKHHYKY